MIGKIIKERKTEIGKFEGSGVYYTNNTSRLNSTRLF
jgi:hypothetical protein